MNPDEPANAPQRWFKEDTGGERLSGHEIDVGKFSGTNETDMGFLRKDDNIRICKREVRGNKTKNTMEYHGVKCQNVGNTMNVRQMWQIPCKMQSDHAKM